MPARLILPVVVGVLMALVGQASDADAQISDTLSRPKPDASKPMLACSSGEYAGRTWRIDENHLMFWDNEPYVRFGFTGNGDVTRLFEAGFRHFTLMPDEKWPIVGPELKYVQAVNDTSDRLEAAGGTYYGTLNAFWPWRHGNLIAESDKAAVFVRDVRDVTQYAGRHTALDLEIHLPIPPAERSRVEVGCVQAVLFDLDHATRQDLSGHVDSLMPVVSESAEGREGDDEREGGQAFRVRFLPISIPESQSVRVVVAAEIGLAEVPGAHGLPPLWKPGIQQFYRSSLESFRAAYAKPGLRGLQFGDEINTFPLSLLTARIYPDHRRDAEALRAYRQWLIRRFGSIDDLNRELGTSHASFDRVDWLVPLHPFAPGLARTDEAAEQEEQWTGATSLWGLAHTVEQLRTISRLQQEFCDWFYGHWLAAYARLAKEVIGPVPVFVCSACIGGPADRYLALHRWALREGVDGLIRNHYGHGGEDERDTLESLGRWMARTQQESGCTKHLWANEVGYVRPGMTDAEWRATEAAALAAPDSFGSQWAFPSQQSLHEMLVLLARSGYRGFNRFLINPSSAQATREVEWMAALRPEIVSLAAETTVSSSASEPLTADQAVAAARADRRVHEMLRGVSASRFQAEFSRRWHVWLVHFSAGDRPLGWASISAQGTVLEVSGADAPREDDRHADDSQRSRSFSFPRNARMHVPDAANAATLVTLDTVAREPYRRRLSYQFVLVEDADSWTLISHRSAVPEDPFPSVDIRATDAALILTLRDAWPQAVERTTFATMEAAIADYQRWLEDAYRIGRIGSHPNKPAWLHGIKRVFTMDLWRPHGEITQGFADVTRFVEELQRAGDASGALLYLCGWSGPYDARYPEYQPAEELGGAVEFRRLVETAHGCGCRVMIHTCPVAFDPWLPSFEQFRDCALRGNDFPGGYRGWPGGYRSRELDLDSGPRAADGETATFRAARACEACMTVGGFGLTPPTVTVRDRSLAVPAGAPDPFTMPFTFFFGQGENTIRFSRVSEGLWYRIHDAREFVHVWTYPFVAMDPRSAVWQDHFTRKVAAVVQEFKLDAVHLDAHSIGGSMWDCLPLFERVLQALPGVAFSAEEGVGEVGFAVFGLSQGSRVGDVEMASHSAVCARLIQPYIRHYWHLVGARSCVPVGVVWNIDAPAPISDEDRRELRRDLARAEQLGVIRTLRVNARSSGLDPETRRALDAEGP